MELFCFSVESSSVQVFVSGSRRELRDLATMLILKPEKMTGPKGVQNVTSLLKRIDCP